MNKIFQKKKKAQQLVEFAIVVPILMMVLFIVIELGSAINARATIGEGIKMALMKVNNLSNLDGDRVAKTTYVENFIKNELIRYLIHHNVPNSGSIDVKVKSTPDYAVAVVNYQYNPYFLIPGLLGGTFPSSIPFSSSQSLNPHIFKDNVFPATPATSYELAMYHTDGSGDFIESGALIDGDVYKDTAAAGNYDVRVESNNSNTAFLLHFYGGIGTHPNLEYDKTRLVSWSGDDLLPPNLRINLKTSTLEVRSPYYNSGQWFDTRIPYVWVTSALGICHLIYIKYNSYEMFLEDDSQLYYKFLFNTPDPFYNRNIRFCGTVGGTMLCNMDQRGTATVNERALRMNPRLGVAGANPDTGNNNYIVGTMEPVYIPDDPTHHFQHVTSHYFSYTDAVPEDNPSGSWIFYMEWDSTNWQNNYFTTISSPHVLGLPGRPSDMADEIYHEDIIDENKNPFFELYRYRIRLCETLSGGLDGCDASDAGKLKGKALQADDVNIDANDGLGWDDVEINNDGFYVVDIVDVYIDSDGDGIPDAWDRDPAHFDVNINGVLDGNEIDSSVFNTNNNRCNDSIGPPLDYEPDPEVCYFFPDSMAIGDVIDQDNDGPGDGDIDGIDDHTVAAGDFTPYEASPGKPFYRSTPYSVDGSMHSTEPGAVIPSVEDMNEWYIYDPPDAGKALYFLTGGVYKRKHPTWWEDGIGGCSNPENQFSQQCVRERRKLKSDIAGTDFIHGNASGAGPDNIDLAPSRELQFFFNEDVFSPNSRVIRTPPAVW